MARNSAHYRPTTIQIELVRGCNRKCDFCGLRGIDQHVEYMSIPTLKLIMEILDREPKSYRPRISIALRGEPTLHPELLHCLSIIWDFAYKRKCSVQMITNGYGLNKENFNDITTYVDDLIVDDYDNKLKTKIVDLRTAIGKDVHSLPIYTMMKGVAFNNPDPKVHRVLINPPLDGCNSSASRVLWTHCGAGTKPCYPVPTSRCTLPFRWMDVHWDGAVTIYCDDFREQAYIKSFHDDDVNCLDDIWRCDRFESFRRILFHKGRTFTPCNKCNHRSMRPGLLPDPMGKEHMEYPDDTDYENIKPIKRDLLIIKRAWEE